MVPHRAPSKIYVEISVTVFCADEAVFHYCGFGIVVHALEIFRPTILYPADLGHYGWRADTF